MLTYMVRKLYITLLGVVVSSARQHSLSIHQSAYMDGYTVVRLMDIMLWYYWIKCCDLDGLKVVVLMDRTVWY